MMEKMELKNLNILLVDDDPIVKEHMGELLGDSFGNVITTDSAVEGFDYFEKERPDIVITDIQMEKMNGLELARAIRAINPETIIIMITGYDLDKYKKAAIDIDIDAYIPKPVNFENLVAMIRGAIKIKHINTHTTNEYIRHLIDISKCAIMEVTSKKITYANQKFLKIFGFKNMNEFFQNVEYFGELFCNEDGKPYEQRAAENFLEFFIHEPKRRKPVFVNRNDKIKKYTLVRKSFFDGEKVLLSLEKEIR